LGGELASGRPALESSAVSRVYMSIEIPDLATSASFVTGSVDRFSQCIASLGPVSTASSIVNEKARVVAGVVTSVVAEWPAQIFSGLLLALGLVLLVCGYKLVRPLNFVAGSYLGATLSLLLLNIFAPTLESCPAIVAVALASGLLLGVLCALKRSSVLAVLGLVAGEIAGDVVYKSFLMPLGAPEYAAFFCIGFFAVLLAVVVAQVGDFAVKVVSAFVGSYLFVVNALNLTAPYVPPPYDSGLLAFSAFKPELSLALSKTTVDELLGSPYIYGPTIALVLLTMLGTHLQVRALKAAQISNDMEALIQK